jgi:hypothetical protein
MIDHITGELKTNILQTRSISQTLNVCSTLVCLINTACSVWLINQQNITAFNCHYNFKHCIHTIHFNGSLLQKCSTVYSQPTGYGLSCL